MSSHPWQRFTRAEATNYVIAAIIAKGFDSKNLLVVDGDPGSVLENVVAEFDKDAILATHASGKQNVNIFPTINMFRAVAEVGKEIGYRGETLKGLVEYLRSLPNEGPIGA